MQLSIKRLHPNAVIPKYVTPGAACFDLVAATVNGNEHVGDICYPGHPVTVGTGLAIEVPEGWTLHIYGRSGHAFNRSIRLANCTGVIDADYRGEIMVKLVCDWLEEDEPPLRIMPGDRVAQAMLAPVLRCSFAEMDELSETARGTGGFGSTGVIC